MKKVMSDQPVNTFSPYFLYLLGSVLLSLCATSCDRRELTYYMEAEIEIRADWSGAGLDAGEAGNGATVIFYPKNGGMPKKVLMGDRTYGKARLTAGQYDVIVFNRSFEDFGSLAFRGDYYSELEAYARHLETRMDPDTRVVTRVIVSSPEKLAVDRMEGFTVTEDMLGNFSPSSPLRNRSALTSDETGNCALAFSPQCLTREVKVQVNVTGLNNIRSAVGTLTGVAESINLSTGKVSTETVTQQFALDELEFTSGSPYNGTLTGHFNTFGFETEIPRQLLLNALLVDGKTVVENKFDIIAHELEEEDGTLVLYIEVTAPTIPDVKPEGGSDSGFDADVEDWGDEKESELPL